MADKSVTAANVLASTTAKKRTITAGATITAGQVVAEDSADSFQAKPADANSATLYKVSGIALHGASDNQPLIIAEDDDDFDPGFVATAGEILILSATAGGVAPVADLASTMYPVVLMIGKANGNVHLKIFKGSAVVPS